MNTKKVERGLHCYPSDRANDLRSMVGTYNELLDQFKKTGVPKLLYGLTGIPIRDLAVEQTSTDARVYHQETPEWREHFEAAYQEGGWMHVNAIPLFYSPQFNGAVVDIDLLRGVRIPWPENGVEWIGLKYHRSGVLTFTHDEAVLTAGVGSKESANGVVIKRALYDLMWPVSKTMKYLL